MRLKKRLKLLEDELYQVRTNLRTLCGIHGHVWKIDPESLYKHHNITKGNWYATKTCIRCGIGDFSQLTPNQVKAMTTLGYLK